MRAPLALLTLTLLVACRPDDVDDTGSPSDGGATDGGTADGGGGDGGGDGGGTADACAASALLGDWLSQGDDVSPLFQSATFDYASIEASFTADCAYTVLATTGAGDQYTLTGTWSADEGTTPASIVQQQSSPYAATAEGIFQVDGDTLTFEVVQTTPDYGFTAPTPSTGFGSTAGQGLSPGDNTQTYQRQ
jgi:hypothetical protein